MLVREPDGAGMVDLYDPFYPWFVGLVDGEGYFKMSHRSRDHHVETSLNIELREDDVGVLEEIKSRLQCGHIYHISKKYDRKKGRLSSDNVRWRCAKVGDLAAIIIPIFDRYPLRSKKRFEFVLWRAAIAIKMLNSPRSFEDELCRMAQELSLLKIGPFVKGRLACKQ